MEARRIPRQPRAKDVTLRAAWERFELREAWPWLEGSDS